MRSFITLMLITLSSLQLACTTDFNHTECKKLKTPKMRRSCCKLPHADDIIKNCRKNILLAEENSTDQVSKQLLHKDKLALKICIAECEFKAKAYLTAPYEVNMYVIEKDLQTRHANDKDYADLLMKGFRKCLKFSQNKTQEFAWLRSDKDCNMFPATLMACATETVYENCPPQKWHATPQCSKMREYLLKCDELTMEKNFHL